MIDHVPDRMLVEGRFWRRGMETQELHRGRLIDHIQLVVRDLSASRRFYDAVFQALEIPLGGAGEPAAT